MTLHQTNAKTFTVYVLCILENWFFILFYMCKMG